jgi:predicted TIM-barrel fold metal-dependent hydrolase
VQEIEKYLKLGGVAIAELKFGEMIATIRRLSPTKDIQRKLLYGNAKRVFRI